MGADSPAGFWMVVPSSLGASFLLLLGVVVLPGLAIGGLAGWIASEQPLTPTFIASVADAFAFPMAFPWDDISLDLGVWQYQAPAWVNVGASTNDERVILALILLVSTILPAMIAAWLAHYVDPKIGSS